MASLPSSAALLVQSCLLLHQWPFFSMISDNFSEVVVRYIHDLGKSVMCYANSAKRTDCNVFDFIQSLEDLSSPLGFSGASNVHHCLVGSGVVREITQYVNTVDEVPFAKPIPKFPISRLPKSSPSFAQAGFEPAGESTYQIGFQGSLIPIRMFIRQFGTKGPLMQKQTRLNKQGSGGRQRGHC